MTKGCRWHPGNLTDQIQSCTDLDFKKLVQPLLQIRVVPAYVNLYYLCDVQVLG
jgi:hypothetical protein